MSDKIRVGILYGGRSGEHEVSLQTALAVIHAFDYERFEIHPFYINRDGQWRSGKRLNSPVEDVHQLKFDRPGEPERAPGETALNVGDRMQAGKVSLFDPSQIDVVFPLLHGTFGEDGTVQGLLEMANIPYVGSGVLASAVGMDKVAMKKILAQAGLPQCVYRSFSRVQWDRDQSFHVAEIEISLGYPCFIKPANLGSSVGISKAKNREQLIEAVQLAFRYDRKVIVEEHVDAREIEVGVLGNDQPQVSAPGEILTMGEFYDYKSKYVDGESTMVIPADLSPLQTEEVQKLAVRVFTEIEASGLSRVDFFLRKADGQFLINEINTMPGFTPFSMYPLLWRESGKSYKQLLNDLIELAFERHKSRQMIDYSNE